VAGPAARWGPWGGWRLAMTRGSSAFGVGGGVECGEGGGVERWKVGPVREKRKKSETVLS
jgi:hypothetical protein